MEAQVTTAPNSNLTALAQRLNIDANEAQNIVINTLMKAKGNNNQVSNEEFITFLAIANEYRLNPLTKEIYAFSNRGAIQPIVSIDGWITIINSHPQFDGMEFEDEVDQEGNLISIICKIYRKDRNRPTEVTEYLKECIGTSEPWKRWPARMLRHKAAIQCARYAFGLSGIVDPDEAERIQSVKDITPKSTETIEFTCSSEAQLKEITQLIKSLNRTEDQAVMYFSSFLNNSFESFDQLSEEQANTVIGELKSMEVNIHANN